MGTAFIVVWGIALLIIVALLVILVFAFRHNAQFGAQAVQGGVTAFESVQDTLLFYYEKESVRSTEDGRVIIRIRGISWDAAWQDDLLRIKVVAQDPHSVTLDEARDDAQVLAVYDFEAYRMTEMGTDISVPSFVKPVEVILVANETNVNLDVLAQQDGEWVSAPQTEVTLEELGKKSITGQVCWAVASVGRLDRLCLIKKTPQPIVDDR